MEMTLEELNAMSAGHLPGLLGIQIVASEKGRMTSRLPVEQRLWAPNGRLHAASVVALADTTCGYACRLVLPERSIGFATLELNANFLGTVIDGAIRCEARLVHGGKTTQVWDAEVSDETSERRIAVFRCTQLMLYPTPSAR